MRAAKRRDGPREAPAVAMEHRQRPQVAREVRHGPRRGVANRVQVRAAMMGDDALRVARRARGVRDGDRVPLVLRRLEPRERVVRDQQRLVLVPAEPLARAGELAVAHVDHDRRAAVGLAQNAQRGADRRRELAVGDQHRALAMVQMPGDERRVEPRVERVEHRVEAGHRVVRLDHLGRVVQHRAHRRAPSDTERLQRRGEPGRAIARLAPGVAAPAVHHRLEVAEDLGAALDEADRREGDEVGRGLVQPVLVEVHGTHPAPIMVRASRRAADLGNASRGPQAALAASA